MDQRPFSLVILALNSNLHFSWMNWQWVDNSGVLQWLVQTLYDAEIAGEKVHIISHIPPGNGDCLGAWGRNYAKIIERYVIHSFYSTCFRLSNNLNSVYFIFKLCCTGWPIKNRTHFFHPASSHDKIPSNFKIAFH